MTKPRKPKKRKWVQAYDGDWIAPIKRGYRMQCCDCGLVHKLNFRLSENGQIQYQPSRDARATAAIRRKFEFEKDSD